MEKFIDVMLLHYERDTQGFGTTIVILARRGDTISRGVALCSPEDTFSHQKGEHLAKQRALRAIVLQASTEPIRDEVCQTTHLPIGSYKSEIHPKLSAYEKQWVATRWGIVLP